MKALCKQITTCFGKPGALWFEALPEVVFQLVEHWQLSELVVVENLSWHYVAKAHSAQYGPVCLKIGYDKAVVMDEARALHALAGQGMVTLLSKSFVHHALLVEQAMPGRSLGEVSNINQAVALYAAWLNDRPHLSGDHTKGFKTVWDWLAVLDRLLPGTLPERMLKKVLAVREDLKVASADEFLLHGDLHMGNLLEHQGRWLAIDPKGVIGPQAFEAAAFDFLGDEEIATVPNPQEVFLQRLNHLAQQLAIDPIELEKWVLLRLTLCAAWMAQDSGDPSPFIKKWQALFL